MSSMLSCSERTGGRPGSCCIRQLRDGSRTTLDGLLWLVYHEILGQDETDSNSVLRLRPTVVRGAIFYPRAESTAVSKEVWFGTFLYR